MKRLTYFEGGRWWVKIGDTEHSGPVADRLAAYEDTGLEPEEIVKLAQAEKDGRLVVLPCIRPFNNGIYGVAYECLFWEKDFGFMTEDFHTLAEAEAALERKKGGTT